MTIKSFKCAETELLFGGTRVRRFVNFEAVAMRKLAMLNRAGRMDDLRVTPGNRLEALKGDRTGQHSIRVNDQYRICFVWTASGPSNVEIVDYH
jgi:proteic killer suppression protein